MPGSLSGKPVPGGSILMLREPTDQGMPNTELATTLEPLARSDYIWAQYVNATYNNSHPAFVFTQDVEKGGEGLTKQTSIWGGNAYLRGAVTARDEDLVHLTEGELMEARARSINTSQGMQSRSPGLVIEKGRRSLRPDEAANPIMRIAASIDSVPWSNKLVTEPGFRLTQPPRSSAPEKLLEIQESTMHQIYRAIGIPSEMISSAHQKHAANVEQTTSELRANIIEFQGKAQVLFSRMFSDLFAPLVDTKIIKKANKNGKSTDVDYLKEAKSESNVEFVFECNPIVSPELLFSYHEASIIRPEKFQEYALMIAGLPQDCAEPDLHKAAQKKLEMQAKAKPQPAGSKKTAGTKKPAASAKASAKASANTSEKRKKDPSSSAAKSNKKQKVK